MPSTIGRPDELLTKTPKKNDKLKLPVYKPKKMKSVPELVWDPEKYRKGQQKTK